MKVFLASDHAGYKLKQSLLPYLASLGYDVEDLGAYADDPEDDYPDYISKVAMEVSRNPEEARGIVLGGSGQGEAIVSNRFKEVRAAVFYGPAVAHGSVDAEGRVSDEKFEIVKLAREHNDANVLSIGARFVGSDDAEEAVKLFLETHFSGEARHARRIKKIEDYG